MRRAHRLMSLLLCAGFLLAACGDDTQPSITGSAAPTTAAKGETTTTSTTAQPGSTLTVVSSSLGEILADASGRTLYVFTNDRPNTSNCTGACLATWPRYSPANLVGAASVNPALIGTIAVDGVQQATIDERPLYYFAGDATPGDVNGQGVGGNWFAVRPNGEPVS